MCGDIYNSLCQEKSHNLLINELTRTINDMKTCTYYRTSQHHRRKRTFCNVSRCLLNLSKDKGSYCPDNIKTFCSKLRTHMNEEELNIFPLIELRLEESINEEVEIVSPFKELSITRISDILNAVKEEHKVLRILTFDLDIDTSTELSLEESIQTGRLLLASLLSHIYNEDTFLRKIRRYPYFSNNRANIIGGEESSNIKRYPFA